jgi:large subunit ribosomal protein L3
VKSVRKALLGRKLGMTQLFAEDGRAVAVTVIAAGPCTVLQRKTVAKEGYDALQIGFEEVDPKRVNKARAGHFKAAAEKSGHAVPAFRHLVEVKLGEMDAYQVGDTIGADVFTVGDEVDVIGTSKGKGFAGAQKRHGFRGGPATHGSMSHRRPASGGATDAARVFKGVKKPGHMGAVRRTQPGLRVWLVDAERHLLAVKGPVPGPSGGLVLVTQGPGPAAKEGE